MKLNVGVAVLAGVLAVGCRGAEGEAAFPSPVWCVRACPEGAASAPRLWNGISPIVKAWKLKDRAEALARLGTEVAAARKPELLVDVPKEADAAHPVPLDVRINRRRSS